MKEVFKVGRGDLLPSIKIRASTKINGKTVPVPNLAGATVTFTMTDAEGTTIINKAPAFLEDAATAVLRYDWQAEDTDTAGEFDAEFELTIGGKPLTIPNDEPKIRVKITEDLG